MANETKITASSSDFEVDPRDLAYQGHVKSIRLVDSVRVGLTALALLCGITILGTSGDALMVYNTTSVSPDSQLSLWPRQFDLRPSVALVVGSAIVVLTNIVSLVFSKVKMVSNAYSAAHPLCSSSSSASELTNMKPRSKLRNGTSLHTPLTFAAPFIGFVAAMISMIFFYAVNGSTTVDTVQSWSCRWESVSMQMKPHFGAVCKETKTALYLSIILIPVEAFVLSLAGYQLILERKAAGMAPSRKGSPALS
ncbi:uncharacterized protein PG986_001259 [Apiospora aurea]|uniref:Uncharacterized protein n=1 Tax=Apiospora aurea TaxID=335848 RepID=A0ABR1QWA3_9PEZI